MKKTTKSIVLCILSIFLFSCSQEHNSGLTSESITDIQETTLSEESLGELTKNSTSTSVSGISQSVSKMADFSNFIASRTASTANLDKTHKLIRSAQMKFRVETVPQATFNIEDIALRNEGIILNSSISNNKSYSTTTRISEDSALVVHYADLAANIQLKIPQAKLDTVLRQIAPLAIEIDYRTIRVRDVTLQILSDSLTQKRIDKKSNRITNAIDNKSSKLNDVLDAEQALDTSLEQADQTLLSAFSLNEQIEFSTIDINIYQNQVRYAEKVLRVKDIEEYSPSTRSQILNSLKNGWDGISMIFVFLLNLWPLFLIIAIAIFIGIRYKHRKKGL